MTTSDMIRELCEKMNISISELARKIGIDARTVAEEPYYRHIDKTGLKLSTKLSMNVSDRFCMVKMVHVK